MAFKRKQPVKDLLNALPANVDEYMKVEEKAKKRMYYV